MVDLWAGKSYITLVTVEGVSCVGIRVVGTGLTWGGSSGGLGLGAPRAVKPSRALNTLCLI